MSSTDNLRKVWIGRQAAEGYPAAYLRQIPTVVGSHKPDPKDERLTVKEYTGGLITDTQTVRLFKHGEFGADKYQRFDLSGWAYLGVFNAPTSTLTGAGTSQIQTLTISGTPTGGTFTLTFDGYTTANITFSVTAATLAANILAALAGLPPINGTANVAVSSSITAPTVTFQGTLLKANLPLMTCSYSGLTGGSSPTIVPSITTAGVGAYTHAMLTGAANKPCYTIMEYDGVDYVYYIDCRVDTYDWNISLKDAVKSALKVKSKFEGHYDGGVAAVSKTSATTVSAGDLAKTVVTSTGTGTLVADQLVLCANSDGSNMECVRVISSSGVTNMVANFRLAKSSGWTITTFTPPTLIQATYQQPIDETQMSVTINSTAFTGLLGAKVSVKEDPEPLNTIGGGADAIRIQEGFVTVDFEITVRYTALASSQYQNWLNNTAPGAIVFQAVDTPTIGAASVPTWTLTLLSPKFEQGQRMPSTKETQVTLKGSALYDATTTSSLKMVLINEVPGYYAS